MTRLQVGVIIAVLVALLAVTSLLLLDPVRPLGQVTGSSGVTTPQAPPRRMAPPTVAPTTTRGPAAHAPAPGPTQTASTVPTTTTTRPTTTTAPDLTWRGPEAASAKALGISQGEQTLAWEVCHFENDGISPVDVFRPEVITWAHLWYCNEQATTRTTLPAEMDSECEDQTPDSCLAPTS